MKQIFRTHSEKFTVDKFAESHSISPKALLYYRASVAIYCLAILVLSWCTTHTPGLYIFFLTNLSWIALTLFFFLTAWIGFLNLKHDEEVASSKIGPWMRFAIWNIYITQVTFQFLVVGIYWSILSGLLLKNPTPIKWFVNINVHGMGLVFVVSFLSLTNISSSILL
jgi:hypothetical protein